MKDEKLSFFFIPILLLSTNTIKISSNQEKITITILYDNYTLGEGTKSDWDFSCIVEGTEKTILFDAGYKENILKHNIDTLNIDVNKVEIVFLSHNHLDHTGGLNEVTSKNSNLELYFGKSFPENMESKYLEKGIKSVRIEGPREICKNVFTSGELKGRANEQSLIVNTNKGIVIITGCSHPGIINIIERVKELHKGKIYMVIGGFHLLEFSNNKIEKIINRMKESGVEFCGPSHCTGDNAISLFKQAYREKYINLGVGKKIEIEIE
ncbi:MBL fold metallo-hydrolase [Bacteroidota bacterium]